MNRDDIIRMAREAGWDNYDSQDERLQRFFLLAAAAGAKAEREAMLDLVDDYAKGNTDLKDAIRARSKE